MADPKGWFSDELEVKGWFGVEPIEYWFDSELYSVTTTPGAITQTVTYTDGDTFYAGSVSRNISGVLYTDPDTFYAGTVTTRINGTLYTDADTFYTGALSASIGQSALYTDSDTFYAGTASQTISGALYTDADTFYGGTVTDSGGSTPVVRPVISGGQAKADWDSRQKWRKQAEAMLTESVQEPVPEVGTKEPELGTSKPIPLDDIVSRLDTPLLSLADLLADAKLLQLEQAQALEAAMAVKDVLAIAELAYLAEVAVQQEKDAIAAFLMFMD